MSHWSDQKSPTSAPIDTLTTADRMRMRDKRKVVDDPAKHVSGALPREVVLTIGWGAVGRVDLEPATCGDPHCEADHGYTGTITGDDLALRVSMGADGEEAVVSTLAFAGALAAASVARNSRDLG